MILTGKQNRHLRGLGHGLQPVVQIGKSLLSESVVLQLDDALDQHELIKIKFGQDIEIDRKATGAEINASLKCSTVQAIGRTMLLFRPRKKDPTIKLPPRGD